MVTLCLVYTAWDEVSRLWFSRDSRSLRLGYIMPVSQCQRAIHSLVPLCMRVCVCVCAKLGLTVLLADSERLCTIAFWPQRSVTVLIQLARFLIPRNRLLGTSVKTHSRSWRVESGGVYNCNVINSTRIAESVFGIFCNQPKRQ